jgi:urea transport system ATP-binding protein
VFVNLTVRDNVELSLRRPSKGVFATLLERGDAADERHRIEATLERVGLAAKAGALAGALSHGEKQWLEIGMVMAQDPELLLVDEPVAGMTDEETARTGELLMAIAADRSVLVIEHDMEFVRQIARKVTVLHQGTVLCEGPVEQVQRDPRVLEVYLGQRHAGEAVHAGH